MAITFLDFVAYEKVTQKHKVYYLSICVLIIAYQSLYEVIEQLFMYQNIKLINQGQGLSSQMSNKLSQIK